MTTDNKAQVSGGGEVERWITQTTFYDPANPDACTGNCTEAAIASILGIALDEVPSLAGMKSPEFWVAVEEFFASRGFAMLMESGNYEPEVLYLASGQSPRGCSHMVVMRDGKLVHDPHPSRAGIESVEHVWLIVPFDPATHPPTALDVARLAGALQEIADLPVKHAGPGWIAVTKARAALGQKPQE